MQRTLLIIAAGKASRMDYLPKAAQIVDGRPNLYNTIQNAYDYFEHIVVITSNEHHKLYSEIVEDFEDKCNVVSIKSGKGCGHAVLESLEFSSSAESVVCWGDTYFPNQDIFKFVSAADLNSDLVIPVVEEQDPYVWFESEDLAVKCARFSKNGEKTVKGYHDQSIFLIDTLNVKRHLKTMHSVLDKQGDYYTNELIFLNICHYMWNIDRPAKIILVEFNSYSFNTHEELREINKRLKNEKKANRNV